MIGIHVFCHKGQLIKLLEEFLCSLISLFEEHELILSIDLLIGVLEGTFTLSAKFSVCSPMWHHLIDNLIDKLALNFSDSPPTKKLRLNLMRMDSDVNSSSYFS